MPSPVGHALGGLIVALVLAPSSQRHDVHEGYQRHEGNPFGDGRWWGAVGVVAACLPDIDFLWGRHNMETHSVGFALLIGAVAWAWARSARLAAICALAVCTHVLFDWLGSDDATPIGVMAWWPLTTEFYFADAWLFDAISRRYWRADFVTQNTVAVLREIALLGPLAALAGFVRRRSVRSAQARSPGA